MAVESATKKQKLTQDFSEMTPPRAEKREHTSVHHGVTLKDNYHWLRCSKWETPTDGVKDADVLGYIKAENAYTHAFFDPLEPQIEQLFAQRKGYIANVDETVPVLKKGYYYYSRQTIDQNYPVYLRRKGSMDAPEEVFFDANKESVGKKFYTLKGMAISEDQQIMAFWVDTSGNEFATLFLRNLETGEQLADTIESIADVEWLPDGMGFYYTKYSPEWRVKSVHFHKLGDAIENDALILEESVDTRSLGMSKSFDKRYLFIESSASDDNSVCYIDLQDPHREIKLLAELIKDRQVYPDHHNGYFYLLVNDTGVNRRLVRKPVNNPIADYEEILPVDPEAFITAFVPYKNQFVLSLRKLSLENIAVMDPKTLKMKFLTMPGTCYDASLMTTTYEDDSFRYEYSSLSQPATVYGVSFSDLSQTVLKTDVIQSGFDPELYHSERIWATARDGVKVPVSLVYRKDKFVSGGAIPLLLYGYGSYGITISPEFNNRALQFADNGFVYAIAHIRGGEDLGYQWYLDGKMMNKKRTFNDFIDCAEALIDQGFTKKGMISAMGGSAGGMLMGAISNDRPDLFKAIVALVPFVDVMNTMLDADLPLTPGEFPEWGNPIESAEAFKYMLSYSPYDNVTAQAYPAMYISGGLTDPRVTYWEPTKWVAKLRELNQGTEPVLLDMIMEAGHGGGSKRDEKIREETKYLTFLKAVYGMDFEESEGLENPTKKCRTSAEK